MSLPAQAASVGNCSPVTCMPSPESPAKRMTAPVSGRRGFSTEGAGITVSLMIPVVLSAASVLDAERPPVALSGTPLEAGVATTSCYPNGPELARITRKKGPLLELEELHFWGPGEVPAAGGLDENHVLDSDGPPPRIVEPGLAHHHLPPLHPVPPPTHHPPLLSA